MESLKDSELREYLLDCGCSEGVCNLVAANELTGQQLLQLTPEEIKEIAPKLEDRVQLRRLLDKCKVSETRKDLLAKICLLNKH